MKKMDFRTLTSAERYVFRKRAISMIKSGLKQKEVAEIFGIRTNTVSDWMKSYNLLGLKGLKDNRKGPNLHYSSQN